MAEATVTLTASHLADGKPRSSRRCPLYRACEDAGVPVVGVRGNGTIVVTSTRDRFGVDARLSAEDARLVRDAVEAIDQGFPEMVPIPLTVTLQWGGEVDTPRYENKGLFL